MISLRECTHHLTILHCPNLETRVLEGILRNPMLQAHLQSLTISAANDRLYPDPQEETEILWSMENLVFLSVPVDLTIYLGFFATFVGCLPLRALELRDS